MKATYFLCQLFVSGISYQEINAETYKVGGEACFKNNTKMCIASATAPTLLEAALKNLDLEKYFLKIFSCGAIGKGKDQPDVFLQAAEFLGTAVEETWVFEDSLVAIETAVKVGFPTVGIYDRYNFGQEKIRRIANEYIADGETLLKLIK